MTSTALQQLPSRSGNGVADNEVEISDNVTLASSDPDESKIKKIAHKLINKAVKGMDIMAKRTKQSLHNSEILITDIQLKGDDPNQVLENLEKSFTAAGKTERRVGTYKGWMCSYVSGCVHLFLRRIGHYPPGEGGGKSRKVFIWVIIIHEILTRLLATEGIIAFAIIFAYAGKSKSMIDLTGS